MHRAPAAATALALAVVMSVTACTPDGASADEVARFMAEWQNDSPPGSLGATGGPVSHLDPEPAPHEGITLAFALPAEVTDVRFECLGEGTVTLSVELTTASSVLGQTFSDLRCGSEGHSTLSGSDVLSVEVNAYDADRDGAWSAVILGTQG